MIRVVLTLLLAAGTAWAQQTTGQTQTPREPPPPNRILLAGTVLLTDGNVPSDRLDVALICNGKQLRKTTTDSAGRFTLEVSNRPTGATGGGEAAGPVGSVAPWPGPAVGPSSTTAAMTGIFPSVGAGRVDMTSCVLRADAIPGFRPATLPLGIRHAMRSPDVGVLILPAARPGATEDPTVSVNTLAASKDARKAVEKAQEHLSGQEPDFEQAKRELEKALKESPDFALAWGLLGQIQLRDEKQKDAIVAFEKAIAADETYTLGYLELARLDARSKEWQACADHSEKLIELDPNVAEAYYLHGAAHYYLGQADVASQSFSALETRPAAARFPRGFFMHGMILARQNQIPEAAKQFEAFLRTGASDKSLDGVRAQVDQQLNTWAEAGIITREEPTPNP